MSDQNKITLCIYHGNCADGFGAAWVVRKALGADIEFHAATYGQQPPDVADKNVIIVDFSYPYETLVEIADQAASVLILDHHKTAQEDLKGVFAAGENYEQFNRECKAECLICNAPHIGQHFDMTRSGAGLTWDFFFPGQPRPQLINHIEDRDLWQFKLRGTREIMADLFSYPQDFAIWDRLFADDINALRLDGVAINRQHQKTVADLVHATKRRMLIGGHDVPVANLPFMFASDAGAVMAEGELFAASYFDTPDGRSFSLRSTDAGMDVSEVAKQYGGGGHRNAAGFRVALDHALAYPTAQPENEAILQQLDNLAWILAEGVLILKEENPGAADWFAEAEAAVNALPLPPPDPSTAAIAFALDNTSSDHDGMEFLRCWNEGDFDTIRDQWPEAPEEVFIGADPLYCKKADSQEIN